MIKALHIVGKQPMLTERAKAKGSVFFISFISEKRGSSQVCVRDFRGPPNLLVRGQGHERAVTLHFWPSLS